MKKWIALFLSLLMMFSCVSISSAEDVSGELTIWLWDNEGAAKAVVEAYGAKYPNVKISTNVVPFADYQTKLFTALAGGDTADVFFMREGQVFQTYVQKGLCMKLDDLIASTGLDTTPFANYLPQCTVNGGIYELPYRGGGHHLYYNKKMFDEAGIPYPDMYKSYTWAEMREVCQKLSKGEGAEKNFGVYMMGFPWMILFQAMQRGTKIVDNDLNVDLDSDAVRQALEWYYNTCVVDGSQLTPAEATAVNAATTANFVAGHTAMIIGGDYMGTNFQNKTNSGEIDFPWGMARDPCDEDVEYSTHSVATCCAINSKAKNPELAFHFLSFLVSEEGQTLVAKAGSKPAITTDAIVNTWRENITCYTKEMADLYFEPVKCFSEPMNAAGPYADTILREEFSLYLTENGQSLDDTINNCVQRLQEEIANLK